jgi:Flp pilus assembly protein TadG
MAPLKNRPQRGTFVVEFAIVFLVLLLLLFGVFELARIMYVYNTLQDATRRAAFAASVTDYRDQGAMNLLRQRAIFRDSAGELMLGAPVTDQHIRIDYLALVRNADSSQTMTPIPSAAMPACPARNRVTCTGNPNDAHCVRLVRARICAPSDGSTCQPVTYQALFGLFPSGARLPVSTTIVSAETLGYTPGSPPCP